MPRSIAHPKQNSTLRLAQLPALPGRLPRTLPSNAPNQMSPLRESAGVKACLCLVECLKWWSWGGKGAATGKKVTDYPVLTWSAAVFMNNTSQFAVCLWLISRALKWWGFFFPPSFVQLYSCFSEKGFVGLLKLLGQSLEVPWAVLKCSLRWFGYSASIENQNT